MDQMPNLGREKEMLDVLGLNSMDDLFTNIPDEIRRKEPLPLPAPQSEEEIWSDALKLLGTNVTLDDKPNFLSAGLVRNFVPTAVSMLATRGEFLTSYTPYQPEVSQGMLQAMWEFQTLISELVDLPVANVSMYDASTAAAEAITCAVRVHNKAATQKDTVYVSEFTPPHRLAVIRNYTQGSGIEIKYLKHLPDGYIDPSSVRDSEGCCAIYVEQPNCFGVLDPSLVDIKEVVGKDTALIVGVDSVSLGIIEPPGSWGADIVVGEGQPFGIGPTAGGPIYGIFACGNKYTRQMPGRIVGLTKDTEEKRAFTLTLSTREQHIRRHRATSNICSNETLIALMGAIHMSLLGPEGLERLALRVAANTELTKASISSIEGLELVDTNSSNFREFRIKLPDKASSALSFLDDHGVIAGLDLGIWWDSLDCCLLIGVDERTSKSDIKQLHDGLSLWLKEVLK
ncbi:MAG: aminomethyl-transferring glycine dehydrogenase [Euryarchaeota archaeon]|nr:aminomethyl-transferring glycine dehydrogenase [Euryarchaeota archaeon]|tara:strand:+ start:2918 stop:4285 length:1368 start_codon:yes stop_codon:yes gene_type:complete